VAGLSSARGRIARDYTHRELSKKSSGNSKPPIIPLFFYHMNSYLI
jgi:hypothetical protein